MSLSRTIRNWWFQIIIILALIVLFWKGCSINGVFGPGQTSLGKDTVTVYLPGAPMTLWDTTEKIIYRDRDFHHYHTDTIWDKDSSDWNVGYMYEKKDTLLDATIGVWAKEKPDSISFSYQATIPTVYRVDTIIHNIEEKVRVSQLYLGPEAIVYPNFKGGFVTADFISSRGWQLEAGIGYGGFNGSNNVWGKVGFKRVISFRKKK